VKQKIYKCYCLICSKELVLKPAPEEQMVLENSGWKPLEAEAPKVTSNWIMVDYKVYCKDCGIHKLK
jgi:hypothetical protein